VFELDYTMQKDTEYRETVLYPKIAREQALLREYRMMAQAKRRRSGISSWLGTRLMRLGERLAGPVEQPTAGPVAPSTHSG
jgi:hypothetical protein